MLYLSKTDRTDKMTEYKGYITVKDLTESLLLIAIVLGIEGFFLYIRANGGL